MMADSLVAFGLVTVDHQLLVDQVPGPNQKVVAQRSDLEFGGPATNAAATAQVLGTPTRLVTATGCGPLTTFAAAQLGALGVDVVDLLADQAGNPPVSTVLVTQATGDRAVVSANAVGVQDDLPLTGYELDGASVLLVDGHHMDTAVRLAAEARSRGITVLFDGGSWKDGTADLLAHVDVAVVSQDFTAPAAGEVLDYLAAQGCWAAAQSAGPEPIRVLLNGVHHTVPVPAPTQLVDTLGAGDVLHGTLAHGLARDPSPGAFLANLRYAATVATASCAYSGAHGWFSHVGERRRRAG